MNNACETCLGLGWVWVPSISHPIHHKAECPACTVKAVTASTFPSDELTPKPTGSFPAVAANSGGGFCAVRNDLHGCFHSQCIRLRKALASNEAWDIHIDTPDHVLNLAVQG
jgi:hypothetical protein